MPVQITSKLDPEDSERLASLSKTQSFTRRKDTMEKLKALHCEPNTDETMKTKSVKDALWYTLVKETSPSELTDYMSKSKTVKTQILPKIQRSVPKSDTMKTSLGLLYAGGMMSKRKYVNIRKVNSGSACPYMPYNLLVKKDI